MPVKNISNANTDGDCIGQSTADKIAFYGATPIVQRTGTAQATSNLASSTDFAATQLAILVEVMNTFTALGIWKGSA